MAELREASLPSIPLPTIRPTIPTSEYAHRLEAVQSRMRERGIDILVVYGDRENSGDLHHLTGFDPRFEEAILLVSVEGDRQILLGNENIACAPEPALGIEVRLFQELSPQAQVRDRPTRLSSLLSDFGIGRGVRVGVAGGKYLSAGYIDDPDYAFSVPSYLIDAVRGLTVEPAPTNETRLFLSDDDGLRTTASAHQLAVFEYAASISSASVGQAVWNLARGSRADRIADGLSTGGVELSVHKMVNFGDKTARALTSPTPQQLAVGDAYQIALGVRGGLTCRAGVFAASEADLPGAVGGRYLELARSYFDVLVTWYQTVRVGATAGEVFTAVDQARGDAFEFALNPGHSLDFEEWSTSAFVPGNTSVLRSGSALQGDIIPSTDIPGIALNIEDGIALADAPLRAELESTFPELWERVETRRRYLRENIGVELHESVLPFSNIPLVFAPFAQTCEAILVTD